MNRVIAIVSVAVVSALVSAGALGSEAAKVKFPGTEQGKRAAAYIKAFNEGDAAKLRAFLEANISPEALKARPIEQRMPILKQVSEEVGTLEPMRVTAVRENELDVTARSPKDQWLVMRFEFEKAAPYKIVGVRFDMLEEPPDLAAPMTPLTESKLVSAGILEETTGRRRDRIYRASEVMSILERDEMM